MRIGERDGKVKRGDWEEIGGISESRDRKINAEGRRLLEWGGRRCVERF